MTRAASLFAANSQSIHKPASIVAGLPLPETTWERLMESIALVIIIGTFTTAVALTYRAWFEHRELQREAAMWHEIMLRVRAGEFDGDAR